MTPAERVYVEGELYLSLEAVAQVFEIQVVWLRKFYQRGLLGSGVDSDRTVCIAALHLDRVATIVRLRRQLGPDVDAISHALGKLPG